MRNSEFSSGRTSSTTCDKSATETRTTTSGDNTFSSSVTANCSTTKNSCTPPAAEAPPTIITTILSDITAIMPNFSSLVSSYRLLVGAAEEIHRIPNVCPDVFERAVRRFDNAGTLIDILTDLLCCKIIYSSEFLRITCAPIDLFRLVNNRFNGCDRSHQTADEILVLEALRRALSEQLANGSCLPEQKVLCPTPTTPLTTATTAAPPPPPPPLQHRMSSAASSPTDENPPSAVPATNDSSPSPVIKTTPPHPKDIPAKKTSQEKPAAIRSRIRRRHI